MPRVFLAHGRPLALYVDYHSCFHPHHHWVLVQRSSDLKNWEDYRHVWMGSEGVKQVNDGDMGQRKMFYRVVVE